MLEIFNKYTLFGIGFEVFIILIVLSFPTYFILKKLLRKFIFHDSHRKRVVLIATIISTPLIYISIGLLVILIMSYYPSHKFDKILWENNKQNRFELSGDIITSKMLIGKTKPEVKQILGDEGNKEESNFWLYYLGFKPDFISIDPDVLDIEFRNGKVIRVEQHGT